MGCLSDRTAFSAWRLRPRRAASSHASRALQPCDLWNGIERRCRAAADRQSSARRLADEQRRVVSVRRAQNLVAPTENARWSRQASRTSPAGNLYAASCSSPSTSSGPLSPRDIPRFGVPDASAGAARALTTYNGAARRTCRFWPDCGGVLAVTTITPTTADGCQTEVHSKLTSAWCQLS